MSDRIEQINRLLDEVGGFLDHPPRDAKADDFDALAERLRRLSDDAFMRATPANAWDRAA